MVDAVAKITNPTDAPNGKAVNDNLGEFLIDTSKAKPIFDENKVTLGSEYYHQVRNNELLKLNEVQRKAVLASIHCTDLALLQGPPGTGKTTVIAEIIWQIISQNAKHKILLTSENNLAVDNALDRLLNIKGVNLSHTKIAIQLPHQKLIWKHQKNLQENSRDGIVRSLRKMQYPD